MLDICLPAQRKRGGTLGEPFRLLGAGEIRLLVRGPVQKFRHRLFGVAVAAELGEAGGKFQQCRRGRIVHAREGRRGILVAARS
jgi:hypothetical protein